MKVLSNGSVAMTQSDGYKNAMEAFNSFLGQFENAEGTLFDKVPDFAGLVNRLPPEVSQKIKELQAQLQNIPHSDMTSFIN